MKQPEFQVVRHIFLDLCRSEKGDLCCLLLDRVSGTKHDRHRRLFNCHVDEGDTQTVKAFPTEVSAPLGFSFKKRELLLDHMITDKFILV